MSLYEQNITNHYHELNLESEAKEKVAQDLDYAFNDLFFEVRGHIAFGASSQDYLDRANAQFPIIERNIELLNELKNNDMDEEFYKEVVTFYQNYKEEEYPVIVENVEEGRTLENVERAINGLTTDIRNMKSILKEYRLQMDQNVQQNFDTLSTELKQSQYLFLALILLMLVLLGWVIRAMLSKIGGPLSEFAQTANLIARGEETNFDFNSSRKDELGTLTKAFGKMIISIQNNEQELVAQNEEMYAQQDELQAQQFELENALEALRQNEQDLITRNNFINGLSYSLNKDEVLHSIVENMCYVLKADKGFIGLIRSMDFAVFGMSTKRAEKLILTLTEGPARRAIDTKKSYMINREATDIEKDYHDRTLYCSDLYVPILDSTGGIEGILIFTKMGSSFEEDQVEESEALAKQITISLERIKLYEESEQDRILTQDIMNTIHEGIQLVDVTGKIIQVNTNFCDLIGCNHSRELENAELKEWMNRFSVIEEEREGLAKFFYDVIKGHHEVDTYRYQTKQPNQRVIQVYFEPLTKGKVKFGTVFVHRDITKEFEVDKMKSEFVSTVSHELRTPLASVLGFTELMLHKELKPERQQKYLTTIYNEANRLTSLINDFLDVQRMESGKQTYEKKYEDLMPIIEQVVQTQKVNLTSHQIHVRNETSSTTVLGDRDKIAQVFMNLISNAIKYSPDGGEINITVYEQDNLLKVAIEDQGLGIPSEAIPHLFTKFYRVDNSDRRRIGGTGLGLSIVKEIMKAHRGDITVASELKKGSTFTVQFPIVKQSDNLIPDPTHHILNSSKTFTSGRNVLIVEDDSSLSNLLATELKESGFNVQNIATARGTLDYLSHSKPDVVVLDITLEDQDLDGWDVIRHMKQKEELGSIPIFISSALEEKSRGIELGANEYLVKPYPPSMLSKAIMQTLLNQGSQGQIMVPEEEAEK
ncbi:ATP-binding protein [Bacillus pinisoli]|uniref:ATP-binding protein n=1 Tax=Bacillus pinisoli TaxID=2901866 RepID=UPI001FF2954C